MELQVGHASLVDLDTGRVVWFNRLLRVAGRPARSRRRPPRRSRTLLAGSAGGAMKRRPLAAVGLRPLPSLLAGAASARRVRLQRAGALRPARPAATDEGGLWALLDREETRVASQPAAGCATTALQTYLDRRGLTAWPASTPRTCASTRCATPMFNAQHGAQRDDAGVERAAAARATTRRSSPRCSGTRSGTTCSATASSACATRSRVRRSSTG
ncbi:MAG: hypothetical protein MZW92_19085 [Comamonadaceae bacterium]|nr:hypothetical protein [Comamonadaceae bacterium]